MSNDGQVKDSWFYYAPNKGAPAFFAVAFGASGLVHLWQCYHYRCFKLTLLYPFCAFVFAAGFAVREYCAFNYGNLNTFIATTFLVYTAPPVLELANYHVLGRILYFVPYCSPLHPGRVFTTFTFLSTIIEILNALGVIYSAIRGLPTSTINTGRALLKTSLVMQLIVACLFVALAAVFRHRCYAHGIRNRKVTIPLITLYTSTALITVRTIYRIVEYWTIAGLASESQTISPLVRHEWFFYVFEATVMFLDCVLLNVFHPRRFLPENNKIYLATDGVTELEGPGWSDDRPLIVTLCDPFDLIGVTKKRNKFWENNESEGVSQSQGYSCQIDS